MIEIEHLSYTYPGAAAMTLQDLSFRIGRGEVFGFLGPSGSGKTTTQKILYKLLPQYEGQVIIDEKNLADWGRDFYERIGVSFEMPNHYLKLTARENLRFFGAFYRRQLPPEPLLERLGLLADADKPVGNFSKGMKMRLNFVRALLHDPELIFLDEPTSGLDPINAKKIKDEIRRLRAEGKTIFITTHNMYDADQLCDHVALLHNGRIVALDTPAALKRRYGQRRLRVGLADGREEEFPLDGLGDNGDFLRLLREHEVESIHSEEATLEDAFIRITGQQLLI